MIGDVKKENDSLQDKVLMLEEKMAEQTLTLNEVEAYFSQQTLENKDKIANLQKNGDNPQRKINSIQARNKEHDPLHQQVVEHEDIIAMVRQHLCSLDNDSGALKEQVSELSDRFSTFCNEHNLIREWAKGIDKFDAETHEHLQAAHCRLDLIDSKFIDIEKEIGTQSTAGKEGNGDLGEQVANLEASATETQKLEVVHWFA